MLPATSPGPVAGLPSQATNQADALGARSADQYARQIADEHRLALQARRERDLTGQLYMVMLDGEGDAQWADIYGGTRIAIPRKTNPYRTQDNLLRPIVDNQVAYHSAAPIQFTVQGRNDAESRAQARIDAALANYISRTQNLQQLLGNAVYFADCVGFCPIHATWRDDVGYDPYEPLYHTQDELRAMGVVPPVKGVIDLWLGNPFDTAFNAGAKRGSVQRMTYGRVLPAAMVRQRLGVDVQGTDRFTSGSVFQRVLRRWMQATGVDLHGTGALKGSERGEEMIALVCRETAPGIDPEWPTGRLSVIALQGVAETTADGSRSGRPILIHDAPLPGGRFSAELFYTSQRFDDVHGERWIAPFCDQQRELNSCLSDLKLWQKRMVEAPTFYSGTLNEDEDQYDGRALIGIMGDAAFQPRVMELPQAVAQSLENRIAQIRESMYRNGGYNAASRGEGNAGDAASKVIFLSQADDTIHGPAKIQLYNGCERLMQTCHALFRDYADVPWQVKNLGDESEESAEEYIDRTKVSQDAPNYKVVLGFGSTPEQTGKQLMGLVTTAGADGKPLMTTDEFQRKWPDQTLYDATSVPGQAQKKRAQRMAEALRYGCRSYREETGFQQTAFADPWVMQAAQQVAQAFMRGQPASSKPWAVAPLLQTDDPQVCMQALSDVIQDDTEDALTRHVCQFVWQAYAQWAQQIQMQQMMAQQQPPQPAQPANSQQPPPQGAQPDQLAASAEPAGIGALQQPDQSPQAMAMAV